VKLEEKHRAKLWRKQGKSITWIAQTLCVSKGSVSMWVRDVKLDAKVLGEIKKRSHSTVAIEKRRQSRIENEEAKRRKIIDIAKKEIKFQTRQQLFLTGVALYWGEGSKRKRNVLEFTNSDPAMIRLMMKFFKDICQIPRQKFRGHVYLHSHLDKRVAEQYWSDTSGIPLKQFHKTSVQKNTKRATKDTLPYGTFAIVVCDTQKKLKMDGWIESMSEHCKVY
jgi:hypothetical protein